MNPTTASTTTDVPRRRQRRAQEPASAAVVPPVGRTIAEAWRCHGRSARELGFWAVCAHAVGRRSARTSFWPTRIVGEAVYGAMSWGLRLCAGIELNREAQVGSSLHLVHGWNIKVHPDTVLGDRVGLMHDVTLGTTPDRPFAPRIGNDVFIGAGARVLGDVVVGDGARIGANSVVVSDVPPGATVMGVPARVLGYPDHRRANRCDTSVPSGAQAARSTRSA
jgi:serine O-acetyltransferase